MLLAVIAGIVIFGALGAGIASMISSGVKSSADHSMAVQALYNAESGLEWAGWDLREKYHNEGLDCEDACNELEDGADSLSGSFFEIEPTYNNNDEICELEVVGWVGSEEVDDSLASRRIKGKIDCDWIVEEGFDDLEDFDDNGKYSIGNHEEGNFEDEVTVDQEFEVKPQGKACFGDGLTVEDDMDIRGELCVGDGATIEGDVDVKGPENHVFFGKGLEIEGELIIPGDNEVYIAEDIVDIGDGIDLKGNNSKLYLADEKNDLPVNLQDECDDDQVECDYDDVQCEIDCEPSEVSQNPVEGEGSWAEE